MKVSFWGILFVILGILGIVMINFFGNLTVSNEQNYYLLKEITEAAMIDALDEKAYKVGIGHDGVTTATDPESMHCKSGPGAVRIIKEKFVEGFTRRFAASAERNKNYKISFDDIDECPPKVTVTLTATESYSFFERVLGKSKNDKIDYQSDANIVNRLSAILESKK